MFKFSTVICFTSEDVICSLLKTIYTHYFYELLALSLRLKVVFIIELSAVAVDYFVGTYMFREVFESLECIST